MSGPSAASGPLHIMLSMRRLRRSSLRRSLERSARNLRHCGGQRTSLMRELSFLVFVRKEEGANGGVIGNFERAKARLARVLGEEAGLRGEVYVRISSTAHGGLQGSLSRRRKQQPRETCLGRRGAEELLRGGVEFVEIGQIHFFLFVLPGDAMYLRRCYLSILCLPKEVGRRSNATLVEPTQTRAGGEKWQRAANNRPRASTGGSTSRCGRS